MPRNQFSNNSKLPSHYANWLRDICITKGYSYTEIRGESQKGEISILRWKLYSEIRFKYPEISTTQIGKIFNRDHSSVTYGLKKFKNLNQGKDYANLLDSLQQ